MITEETIKQAVKNIENRKQKWSLFYSLFCSHDYTLLNQFEMKSEFDIVAESGYTPNSFCSIVRTKITDYKCLHCDKIKRLIVKTAR